MAMAGGLWAAWGAHAERVDRRLKIRERVGFVPPETGDDQLFVSAHEPLDEPRGGVLLCSSLLADFLSNYQREVFLARHLAAAGLVAVRFHYAGTGNSDGLPAAVTLDSMRADARWVGAQVRDRLGGLPVAFVGARWGVVPAIAAAEDAPGAPFVLCEPVADAKRYFREAMRSRAMSAIATSGTERRPSSKLPDLLAADGQVDVVGHVIHRALYESAVGVDVLEGADRHPHPALIVQFQGADVRRDLQSLHDRLAAIGWTPTVRTVDVEESWWFRSAPRIAENPELNEVTSGWLLAQLDRAGALR